MGRILFWLALGVILYVGFQWWQRQQRLGPRSERRPRAGADAEPMVRCEVCGLNVPKSEALTFGERSFCCEEHRTRAGRDST